MSQRTCLAVHLPASSPTCLLLTVCCLLLPQMHVLGMGDQLQPQALSDMIAGTRWQRVVAIKPTGDL